MKTQRATRERENKNSHKRIKSVYAKKSTAGYVASSTEHLTIFDEWNENKRTRKVRGKATNWIWYCIRWIRFTVLHSQPSLFDETLLSHSRNEMLKCFLHLFTFPEYISYCSCSFDDDHNTKSEIFYHPTMKIGELKVLNNKDKDAHNTFAQ